MKNLNAGLVNRSKLKEIYFAKPMFKAFLKIKMYVSIQPGPLLILWI